MGESHMRLLDRHSELSYSFKHLMAQCESSEQGLRTKILEARMDTEQSLVVMTQRLAAMDEVVGVARLQAEQGHAVETAVASLERKMTEIRVLLGKEQDDLADQVQGPEQCSDEQAQGLEQASDDGTTGLLQRLGQFEKRLDDIEMTMPKVPTDLTMQSSDGAADADVQELKVIVNAHAEAVARHAQRITGIEGEQIKLSGHVGDMECKSRTIEDMAELLTKRTDMLETDLNGISATQNKSNEQLSMAWEVLNKTLSAQDKIQVELSTTTKSLVGTSACLGELTVTVDEVNARLDTAHEFVEGLNKGLQDTHRHVMTGTAGMLAPEVPQTSPLPCVPPAQPALGRRSQRPFSARPFTAHRLKRNDMHCDISRRPHSSAGVRPSFSIGGAACNSQSQREASQPSWMM